MTTLSDLTYHHRAALDARGSSGSTLKAASAVGLLMSARQISPVVLAAPGKRLLSTETAGTGTEIMSLRISQQDLLTQLTRVYRVLNMEQVDLDAEASRVLRKNLWSLY